MTLLDISIPLGLGVVSSLHCAQMCGPIVLSYSLAGKGSPACHLSYNAGRILTYSALGAVAGAAGGAMGIVGRFAGFQQTASIVAGVLMVLAGLFLSGAVPAQALVQIDRFGVNRLFSRTVGKLMLSGGASSKLALGMLLGFMPCGLLYAAILKAMATGDAAGGALSMASFGLGTAASLLMIGLFSTAISRRLGRYSNALASISIVVTGAFLVWRGLMAKVPEVSCHGGL